MSTQDHILDIAERLFARQGVEATSLRAITSEAQVNIAAVNYHFGSKEGLVRSVLKRRFDPLCEERLDLLEAAEAASPGGTPQVREILQAMILPACRFAVAHPDFMRVVGRMQAEGFWPGPRKLVERFECLRSKMLQLVERALPELPREEIFWRMHFTLGAMVFTWLNAALLERNSGGICKVDCAESLAKRLVAAGEAILQAPVESKTEDA
jgi:AcrR family transcriptional regulator